MAKRKLKLLKEIPYLSDLPELYQEISRSPPFDQERQTREAVSPEL